MASTLQRQLLHKEARLSLATAAIYTKKIQRVYTAAKLYETPRSNLDGRLAGALPQAIANAKKRKLLPTEEQSLVQWILDLDRRGFPPQIIDVGRIANVLLAARAQDPPPLPVDKCWVSRFINTQPELQTKWNRKFHSHSDTKQHYLRNSNLSEFNASLLDNQPFHCKEALGTRTHNPKHPR
jgi:hypothetical protein